MEGSHSQDSWTPVARPLLGIRGHTLPPSPGGPTASPHPAKGKPTEPRARATTSAADHRELRKLVTEQVPFPKLA